jgi:agmatine deiminase
MMRALAPGEEVHLLVNDSATADRVRHLANAVPQNRYRLHTIPTNDAWTRDYGPNFLVRSVGSAPVAFNKWGFNSWGGKYDHDKDNAASWRIAEVLGLPVFDPGIVLEGGGIEVNGQGLCLTTEQCLLNPTRNPDMTREKMETYLKNHLGVQRVVWCQGEMEGDDTDGHIDNLARFVAPDTVLCSWGDDPADPNTKCLQENYKILTATKDAEGKPLTVIKLPMPYIVDDGERLPASHANFYIGNRVVLLPVYGQDSDRVAQELLRKAFPQREIVSIDCNTFIWGLGAMHCVTQQQPAPPKK